VHHKRLKKELTRNKFDTSYSKHSISQIESQGYLHNVVVRTLDPKQVLYQDKFTHNFKWLNFRIWVVFSGWYMFRFCWFLKGFNTQTERKRWWKSDCIPRYWIPLQGYGSIFIVRGSLLHSENTLTTLASSKNMSYKYVLSDHAYNVTILEYYKNAIGSSHFSRMFLSSWTRHWPIQT
jgi:hypothetical protein